MRLDQTSESGVLDWKTIGNYALLVGLFATTITMFNQVYGRLDIMQAESNRRFDAMQAETGRRFEAVNTRFDAMQAEMSQMQTAMDRRFDTMQAELNQVRAEMNRRFDTLQAENQRQHDAIEEVLRVFEGRITRLEEKAGIGPEDAE